MNARALASHLLGSLRQGLLEVCYLGADPAAVIRHRRRSTVLAGPGFLGFGGGVCNPGAVTTAGGEILLLCKGQMRHWLDAAGAHHRDYMVGAPVLIRLDRDDLRVRAAATVSLEGFVLDDTAAIEDFRLFRVGEEIWSNFNVIQTIREPERTGYSTSRVVLARLDTRSPALQWIGPPQLDFDIQPREKNWVFVERSGDLIMLYGLSPYRVLGRSGRHGRRFATVVQIDSGPALDDVGGFGTLTSYSTNPIPYDDRHFLALVHQVDPSGMGRLYHHWALLIDRATLRPVCIGRSPLLSGVGARGRLRGVLYATAVVIRGDEVLVFHGEGDSHASYTSLGRAVIDGNWIALPPPTDGGSPASTIDAPARVDPPPGR